MTAVELEKIDALNQRATQFESLAAALAVISESGDLPGEHFRTLIGLAGDIAIEISSTLSGILAGVNE
jgi:hypothetical protein